MNAGLRELLGLPQTDSNSTAKNGDFRQTFRDGMAGLNGDLQMMASQGNPAAHGKLASQRETLYAAYQTAAPRNDPSSNQKVIAAVTKTGEIASNQKASAVAGREEWLKREAEFDAAVIKIGELEDADHPKAATYRALSEKILTQANSRDYQQAIALLDTVEPKLTEAHSLYVNSSNGAPSGGENRKAKDDSDIGSAKTPIDPRANTAQGPQSKNDMGSAKTPMAPAPNNSIGGANTPIAPTPPAPPSPPNPTGTGDDAPRIKPSPGDGQPVDLKEAFEEMRKPDGRVRETGSHDYHRRIWQQYMGKTGEPPIAYRYSNEIRIDVERLTPDQHKQWLELDKAKNPGRYPQPVKTPAAAPPVKPGSGTVADTVVSQPSPPKRKPQPKGGPIKGWYANVAEISPQLTLQRSNEGIKVHPSVSPETHQSAWEDLHGKAGKAPVAYMVDNMIHVDMSRWPKDVPLPKLAYANATAGQPDPKAPTAQAPKAPTSQVNLKQLESQVADFARRAEAVNKAFESYEKSAGKGAGAKDEATKLQKQSEALKAEGEALVKKLAASPELADIAGKTSKETFDRARAKGQRTGGGGALGTVMQLANAFDLLQDIQYILKADGVLDGIQRAVQVGGKQAMGAAQMALFTSITRSTPVAAVLTMVLGMCGDQANACEAQEEARRQEEQDKQLREQARQEAYAIGKFLDENVPGSVEWLEDHWVIKNKKVWDATARRVDQMRREAYAKQKAERLAPFEKMGAEDGLAGAYPQKGKAWDSSENLQLQTEAVDAYEKTWKQGNARRKDALKRAKGRGQRDGMEGKPINLEQLWSFPEIDELRRRDLQHRSDGFSFTEAYEPFVESYKQGHRAGSAKFTPPTVKEFKIGVKGPVERYGQVKLFANVVYTDGKQIVVSDSGTTWTTDNPTAAIISYDKETDSRVVRMMDSAQIKAQFYSEPENKVYDHTITLAVKQPAIFMAPSTGTYSVGQKVQFVAKTANWPQLGSNVISWHVDRSDIVRIDQNGNAEMLQAGEAEISVTENETSPLLVTARIKVMP
jgi:hypothetical protein